MKVLYKWLKDFVPLEITPEETASTLARLGFEIAGVQKIGGNLQGVVTALVKECTKHPNADRLSLCTVWDGHSDFAVVCGAPNVKTGQKVAFARVGAVLPNGETLRAAKIRGVESQGMICSASELGLAEKSDGILVLPEDVTPGVDVRPVLDLDDALIEIELTPNRRDALGIIGVARELAAGLNLPLKTLEPRARELDIAGANFTVVNESYDLCPRYTARYFREIKVGPSPDWMVRRLERCGYRSINNLVDITNYVMHELGQPLHVFDAARLVGRQIRIRRAKAGETILTLEDKTATLEDGMLVIADEKRPAAVAGVIGGRESAVSEKTTEIILESAAFAAPHIRQTSKTLGIKSESSYRFERGSDLEMVPFASRRAGQLIQELAGGLGYKPIEVASQPSPPVSIKLRTARFKQFLGIDLKESLAADLLRKLGCVIGMGTGQLLVTVPSWRSDLTMEADLLEEIARLHGYDQIPARHPAVRLTSVPDDSFWSFERKLAVFFAGLGYSEAVNSSFLNLRQGSFFIPPLGQKQDSKPIPVANPLSQEQAILRTSLLPGLLQSALLNFHRQNDGVQLFEIGRIFFEDHEGRHEARRCSLLLAGEIRSAHWRRPKAKATYYDVSGTLESLFSALHLSNIQWLPRQVSSFHPKRCAAIMSGSTVLGWVGELNPEMQSFLDTTEPLVAAELDSHALFQASRELVTYSLISPFPPVRRDLSFVAPLATPYAQIDKTLRSAGGKELESVALIDLFRGEKIGQDKKSMTVSLVFRAQDKTLSDADIDRVMKKIISELETKCDAKLRG